MKCPKCGSQLNNTTHCEKCGFDLKKNLALSFIIGSSKYFASLSEYIREQDKRNEGLPNRREPYPDIDDSKRFDKYLRDRALSDAVIEEINNLGIIDNNPECSKRVKTARSAYERLTDEQKRLVSNYSNLTSAETSLSRLQEKAERESEQKKLNQKAANAVERLIREIPDIEFTEDCRDRISEAREAYGLLSNDQKKLVSNISTLIEAESSYADLAGKETEKRLKIQTYHVWGVLILNTVISFALPLIWFIGVDIYGIWPWNQQVYWGFMAVYAVVEIFCLCLRHGGVLWPWSKKETFWSPASVVVLWACIVSVYFDTLLAYRIYVITLSLLPVSAICFANSRCLGFLTGRKADGLRIAKFLEITPGIILGMAVWMLINYFPK